MTGMEIDFVVSDSIAAFALYEKVFGAQKVEITAYPQGRNEAIFTIMGTRFHILDENPPCGLVGPQEDKPGSVWFNLVVEDIRMVFQNAADEGFSVIQPVTEMMDLGVINAVLKDSFGMVWMLHQIVREIPFKERCRILEKQMSN